MTVLFDNNDILATVLSVPISGDSLLNWWVNV